MPPSSSNRATWKSGALVASRYVHIACGLRRKTFLAASSALPASGGGIVGGSALPALSPGAAALRPSAVRGAVAADAVVHRARPRRERLISTPSI